MRCTGWGPRLSKGDPAPARTLRVFEEAQRSTARTRWNQADVDRAIIRTLTRDPKEAEGPLRPAGATLTALNRHHDGHTPETREARREAILSATPERVRRALLATLDAGCGQAATCIVAGRDQLEHARRELGATGDMTIEDLLAPPGPAASTGGSANGPRAR